MVLTRNNRPLLIGQGATNRDKEDAQLCVVKQGYVKALCGRTIAHIWPYIPVSCVGNYDREWCPRCKQEYERLKLGISRDESRKGHERITSQTQDLERAAD